MSKTAKNSIKILVFLFSIGFILFKILNSTELITSFNSIINFNLKKSLLLALVFILMPINWGIETVKWKFLLQRVEPISMTKSIRGVLIGLTSAFFTPNRIGESLGRILVLNKKNKVSGLLCTAVGSFSQQIITLITGFIAFTGFIFYSPTFLKKTNLPPVTTSISVILILTIVIYLYFNFNKIVLVFNKVKFLSKYKHYFEPLLNHTNSELSIVLILSLFRYIIFSTQFYILLITFGINLHTFISYGSIALIYLISGFLPRLTFLEFGIRGAVGIIIINFFSSQTIAIVSSSIILWFINITLPAIVGSIMFYKSKI